MYVILSAFVINHHLQIQLCKRLLDSKLIILCPQVLNNMVRIAEAQAILTSRGESRVILRFAEKPNGTILNALRSTGGKYRRVAGSNYPAWYFDLDSFNLLRRKLQALGMDELSSALKRGCRPLNREQMKPRTDPCGKKRTIETVNKTRGR